MFIVWIILFGIYILGQTLFIFHRNYQVVWLDTIKAIESMETMYTEYSEKSKKASADLLKRLKDIS